MPLAGRRGGSLRGRARVPGDKSISHRALLVGLLTVGASEIEGLLEGEDVLATVRACAALGGALERRGPGAWTIRGAGIGTLLQPAGVLDFGNAGTGTRLAMGVVAGHPIEATFDGDASLRKRPMRRVLEPLVRMGVSVVEESEGGRLPIRLRGAQDPIPIDYESPVPSAQVKSAVLLCGLAAPGETTLIEKEATRDHTERMLRHFGAEISVTKQGAHGRRISLRGRPELTPQKIVVPADPSSAAFPLVAALIVPGSELILEGVLANPLRAGLYATLREMGASIEEIDRRDEGGEPVVDLRVRASSLRGVDVPAARAPSMIDEYPVLAVAAAFAEGETRLRGLAELRVKESDRLAAIAAGLAANGVEHEIAGDDLIVRGRGRAKGGGTVVTHMDHRIAMSFLVMGLASDKPVAVDDASFVATSFPGFAELMSSLGAEIGA
ncbi:MAG: 3-phosphoshikimate 1-carboxyvinyltransferase [Bradyrhizobiaceae bacterium]|nr:3-phosphoshikimate 1-carboxyvinyltransferase [Bradyrhizobiaceae bacterium]